ncbi:MAG: S8 family peptidase, partial [Casimicrobiaceae bacterium]
MNPRSTAAAIAFPRAARMGAALVGVLLLAAATLPSAWAENVYAIRVRLNPEMVKPGPISPAQLMRLQMLAGTKLTQVGTTRTGALEFALAEPVDAAVLIPRLRALRQERSILWAEPAFAANGTRMKHLGAAPRAATPPAYLDTGYKLMVRINGDLQPDWTTLLPRFIKLIGAPVIPERQIGNVWVLKLLQTVHTDVLSNMAQRLQDDPAVQYADPVLRRFPKFVPNDPFFPEQWALTDPIGGINVQTAWDLQLQGAPVSTIIALIDTGILSHPDLANRILPGYDFISDSGFARDGNARDSNPLDQGDWRDDGACGGFPSSPSTWHGTFVSGIMAGDVNNGNGMSGIDLYARILPVRVLGACGGTDEDVFEGMLWASGVQIAGVPPNPFPAKVINMSLGGFGSCPNSVQDAIDDALAQGSVVVVAAGNESSDTSNFAPSGCNGVITVGATNRAGDLTFYSNFGRRVDLSAPGGDFDDGGILSLSNDGQTVPTYDSYSTEIGTNTYATEIGTSTSAPHVSGVVSMMLARDPTLTAGRVLSILQGTARDFPLNSTCRNGSVCGTGILDAGLALASVIPGGALPPAGAAVVVEYYRDDLDHYYYTADPSEIYFIDNNPLAKNKRTGLFFFAWVNPASAPPGAQPMCKFYGSKELFIDSYYYTADPGECQFVIDRWPGVWTLVNAATFWVLPTDADGLCSSGTIPVFRFSNNR